MPGPRKLPFRSVPAHDSARTRAAILQAAERIFAEVGEAGARTETIAAAAGVNKAMLHYYFQSKDGLYRAVLDEHFKQFHRQAMEVLSSRGPAREILLRYVGMHFDFISARPYYPRLFIRMAMSGDKGFQRLIRRHLAPLSRKLVALIERGRREGEFHALDSAHAAISLIGLTVFYFSVVRIVAGANPYRKASLARRRREVFKFVRYAMFKNPEETKA
ncbi:MAG TPA: TetR/AcrR family transcriptional regulator [Terriglobia bacterium]|nr:TetR/AcrR family transcriptional regulator [Terriglobia bacterium]